MYINAGIVQAPSDTALGSAGTNVYLNGNTLRLGAINGGSAQLRGYNDQHNWSNGNFGSGYANVSAHFDGLTANFNGTTAGAQGSALYFNGPTNNNDAAYSLCGWSRYENYAARVTGAVRIPSAGTYQFSTRSDDGSMLWANNGSGWTTVVSNNGWQGMTTRTGSIYFPAAGWYQFEAMHYEGGGGDGMIVQWDQGTNTWVDLPNSAVGIADTSGTANYGTNLDVSTGGTSTLDVWKAAQAVLGNLNLGAGQTLQVMGVPGANARFAGTSTLGSGSTLNAIGVTAELAKISDAGSGLTVGGGAGGSVKLTGTDLSSFTGPITVSGGGTVAFGAAGVVNGHNVVLNGGNLDKGTAANTIGSLTMN